MKPFRLHLRGWNLRMAVFLLGLISLPLCALAQEVRIAVRDENSGSGVLSKVVLVKGESQRIPVDNTGPDGVLSLTHNCSLGERFVAQPIDESFYESNEDGCKKEVKLLVVKRESPLGKLAQRETREITVKYGSGLEARYLVAWNARVDIQFDESNRPGPPPHPNERPLGVGPCNIGASTTLERTITLLSATGDPWQLVQPSNRLIEYGRFEVSSFRQSCDSMVVEDAIELIKGDAIGSVARRSSQDAANILLWAGEKGYSVEVSDHK